MTTSKLYSVIEFYRDWLLGQNAYVAMRNDTFLDHLLWMCQQCLGEHQMMGQHDKSFRWLGFIQGVLCTKGYFTIDQLRNHSRS